MRMRSYHFGVQKQVKQNIPSAIHIPKPSVSNSIYSNIPRGIVGLVNLSLWRSQLYSNNVYVRALSFLVFCSGWRLGVCALTQHLEHGGWEHATVLQFLPFRLLREATNGS